MLANTPHNPACKKEYTIAVASVFHSFDERLLQGDPWMHNKIYKQKITLETHHAIMQNKIRFHQTVHHAKHKQNRRNKPVN